MNMKKSFHAKILLNMQMSPLDYEQGVDLLKLICDLEDSKRDDVVIMLTHRYDMTPDPKLIELVDKKFEHVIVYVTTREESGWPAGPNAMMGDSYLAAINLQRGGLDIEAVMFMECDCVPLAKDWINQIKSEWDKCRAAGKSVLGPWLEKGDASIRHINGNCVIAIEYWKKNREILHAPSNVGWDAYHANNMCAEGYASSIIFSDYRLGTKDNPWKGSDYLWEAKKYGMKENPLYGNELFPVWLHGCKTRQAIKASRKKLLTSS